MKRLYILIFSLIAAFSLSFPSHAASVSSGDADFVCYDYSVSTLADSSAVFKNVIPNGSVRVNYNPSVMTTTEIVSVALWSGNLSDSVGTNYIRFNLPHSISLYGLSSVNLASYSFWINKEGVKYELGKSDWIQCRLPETTDHEYIVLGVDLHLINNTSQSINFWSGVSISGSTSSTVHYLYDKVDSVLTNYNYVPSGGTNYYNRTLGGYISIMWHDASYSCSYREVQQIGLLKSIVSNIEKYGKLIVDSLTTGYTDSTVSGAADDFANSADSVSSVTDDLSNTSSSSVNGYISSSFDGSLLTTLGSSLGYVVTWFTNFWNMGGLFTKMLNTGLAVYVAFRILRLKGDN